MKKEISVIVCCYNPDVKSLKATLRSVIYQENVNCEIIIADDGSKKKYMEEISGFMNSEGCDDFRFIRSTENYGTVSNVYRAVKISCGKYIKLISPGDLLYSVDTLYNWLVFLREHECAISFGKIINYCYIEKNIKFDESYVLNRVNSIYVAQASNFTQLIDYVIVGNRPIGAGFITEKEILEKYLGEIDNKIKYCEDVVYRHMIADSIGLLFYDEYVVWYEKTSGISNNHSKIWNERLSKDYTISNDMIVNRLIQKKHYWIALRLGVLINIKKFNDKLAQKIKYFIFPSALLLRINNKTTCCKVSMDDKKRFEKWNGDDS